MNRTDRLLAIVLELQRKGRQRAEDLAATFETSKRTIYRDIEALCEAGVPLISVPGQGYRLMQGYFLPPLSFTMEEATMLLLGGNFMSQNFDAQYRESALSAVRKIEAVLPQELREDVQYLQDSIQFLVMDAPNTVARHRMLQQLRRALIDRTTIRFLYYSRHRADEPEHAVSREADPYRLVFLNNAWHLCAFCHLRQDIRNFRLDRIEQLELLPRTFQRPDRLQTLMQEHQQERSGTMIVRVLFDQEVARWVREARSYYMVSEEESADGLLVTLRVRHERDILQWLLSWGRHARVLEPATLCQTIQDEAASILHTYSPGGDT